MSEQDQTNKVIYKACMRTLSIVFQSNYVL